MAISKIRSLAWVVPTLVVAATAWGQADEQNKLLAKRAAEADAYRKLAETIKGIQITSETFVRDFVTESDVIESELDDFIKGIRLGKPTYYEDGTCEVEAEVTVASVVERLKQIHTRHYEGGRVVGTDFDRIERTIEKKILKVIGMGAPRSDMPVGQPGLTGNGLGAPSRGSRPTTYPAIWQSVAPQGKLMAAQAARRDAQRKLLERIMGVRINSTSLVRDFVAEFDEIMTKADGMVLGAQETRRRFHHDELIVDVTMAVPTEQVIRTIKELHTRHYQGDRVTGTDIESVRERIRRKVFEATGSGVPPSKYMREPVGETMFVAPDWASRKILATGHGTDPRISTAQGRLKAIRAATVDARRQLIEQLHGFRLTSTTYVRDFLTVRDEIRTQVQSVIAGSVVEDRRVDSEMATVTVSIGGPTVWTVLHSQLLIESRR